MCGIAGIINYIPKKVYMGDIRLMMQLIKHRGPNDEGIFEKDHFVLAHVRLSIIDLSQAGHQPMFSNDSRFCIIFNGEIYNYIELKQELIGSYTFISHSDTEVILAAYQLWGKKCLDKLNGDFAFVIYDALLNEFFGARDRFGIKPFYYYQDEERFIFASEIKAIIPFVPSKSVNNKLVFEYLVYNRTDQSTETFFQGIYKLPHGHYFTIKNGTFTVTRWYNLSEKLSPIILSPAEYREELKQSVRLRLRSDVPVGVSLSGGIDSSAITSVIIHDFKMNTINTFSAVYNKDQWADESRFIDEYKSELKNMFYTRPTADTFHADYQNFIRAQGEPVASIGPYAQYKVMELASKSVTVTLDGQGADEMLAGYHNFFGSYFKELLLEFNWLKLISESVGYFNLHHSVHAFNFMGFYMLPATIQRKVGSKLYGSISKEFYSNWNKSSEMEEKLYNPKTLNESLLQHFEYKLEHLLKWDDLNSLNFSIESRVPFLDHNLVEKTLSLPPGLKICRGVTKHILRESLKDILPTNIYNRSDKKPFSTPSDEWFRHKKFQEVILDMLSSSSFREMGYLDVEDCKSRYYKHLENKLNIAKDIWKWINIFTWLNCYIKPSGYNENFN